MVTNNIQHEVIEFLKALIDKVEDQDLEVTIIEVHRDLAPQVYYEDVDSQPSIDFQRSGKVEYTIQGIEYGASIDKAKQNR